MARQIYPISSGIQWNCSESKYSQWPGVFIGIRCGKEHARLMHKCMNQCHAEAQYIQFFNFMMYTSLVEEVVLVVEGRFPQKVWSFEACWRWCCYWCQLTLILQIRRHKKFNSVIHPTELDQQNMRKYIEICSNPKSENLLNVCQILHVFVRVSDNTIVHSAARLE